MPFLRPDEIRKMSPDERKKKLNELYAELMRLRAQQRVGSQVTNPARIKLIKKAIARILTIEREEQLAKEARGK